MTNHPDETHSLRERVDEAISWFTGTDEPAADETTDTAADAVPAEVPPAAADGTEPVVSELADAPLADGVDGPEIQEPGLADEPVAADSGDAADTTEPAAVADAAPEVPEPVADESLVEPVADVPAEPAVEATPAVTWPAAAAAMPAVSWPRPTVSPEAVADMESEGGPITPDEPPMAESVAAPLPEEPPTIAEEPEAIAEEPSSDPVPDTGIEASDVDEPTRIHPIDAALGVPVDSMTDEAAAATAGASDDTIDDDFTEPVAADAAADAEAAKQRSLFRDEAPTAPLAGAAVLGAAAAGAVPATERTAVLDAQEAARLRREERAARDRQLGKVIASQDDDEPPVLPFTTPSTYKGLPSFGFFLFRLIIGAVVGIRAYQHITHLSATREMWGATVLQSPGTIAWVQIGVEIAIAVMLILGLGTRIAGVLLIALSVMQLVFVQWGAVNPFQPNAGDFIGVVDVLLAGVGLLFATVGGGRAAIDGAIHVGHVRRKNSKLFA